jgi:hypothetical protein
MHSSILDLLDRPPRWSLSVYQDSTPSISSSISSLSIALGFLKKQLPIKPSKQITPKTFHVKNGPKGHSWRTSSSKLANLLHKTPARNGAKALAREATPCARPFKTPSVPFDGALFVILGQRDGYNGEGGGGGGSKKHDTSQTEDSG